MKKNRNISIIVISILFVFMTTSIVGCSRAKGSGPTAQDKIVYICPMHPSYTSDKPADCMICGMKLVKQEKGSGSASAIKVSNAEKYLAEVCVAHSCTVKDCQMQVLANLKPGERMACPVCGEYIVTTSGKAVEVAAAKQPVSMAPASKERKLLYYRNPMNPQATSPVPMKDSMGMDYVPVYEEALMAPTGPTVMISQEKQQLIGVKTEPVKMADLTKVIRASGKIAYDPELVVTQEEFIQALKNEENSKDSPLQDVIERAKSMTDAARNKLKLLGMSDDQIAELEKNKQAQTNLYLPGKGESVWAYISVYEYEIGLIKVGSAVDIDAVAYPGETFHGTVVSISPVLDSATRTNQVRVEVVNTGDKLKPEMFVNAKIKVDLGTKLAVPESAVIDTGLRKIVYLSKEGDVLESREVTLGQKAEGYYEVLGGLKEGDIVVTSGNFLVDSESKLKSASQNVQ